MCGALYEYHLQYKHNGNTPHPRSSQGTVWVWYALVNWLNAGRTLYDMEITQKYVYEPMAEAQVRWNS